MNKTGIGLKISDLIRKNKKTKIYVAEKLCTTRQTLDDYIKEKTSITVDKLYILAEIFNIHVSEFFVDDKIDESTGIDKAFNNLKKEIVNYIDERIG